MAVAMPLRKMRESGGFKPAGHNQGAAQLVRSLQQMRVIRNATTEFSI
jgi:hypothetical protein